MYEEFLFVVLLYSLYSPGLPDTSLEMHIEIVETFRLPIPCAHYIFFVENEFDVDSNDVLTPFQCVGMMPIIYVVGTIAVLHNYIHFAPAMVWFSAGGAHFSFCRRYPSLGCCDVTLGCNKFLSYTLPLTYI